MRIDDNTNSAASLGQTAGLAQTQAADTQKKAAVTSSSSAAADGLELSKFADSLSRIMQSDSASRSQRVAQLAAAVQSGTYQVDPEAVSRAMVDHVISSSQNDQ